MELDAYLASLRGKRLAVIGIGVSNTPLIRLLLEAGLEVTACDRASRESFGETLGELESRGAKVSLGERYLDGLEKFDVVFRTPGMRPDLPQLEAARRAGARVTSEMEVFFETCPAKLIGVTGSDGKTTTTTIVAGLLEAAGYRTFVGGNIGRPLLPRVREMGPEDMAVLELSSFQLMTMDRSPHIAVVTNLAPNHLDVHRSMEEYVEAKRNILRHQGERDRAVLNWDNEITRGFAQNMPGEAVFFSRRERMERGTYLDASPGRESIWLADGQGERRPVLPVGDIRLPGVHNVENYMAAIAAVDGLVSHETICGYARTFGGVEHRIELVRELEGVRYYNDSIASSPSRTMAGLRAFSQKVILIAGGYDKKIPYDVLGPDLVSHVKLMILIGDTAPKLRDAAQGAEGYRPGEPEICDCGSLKEAVLRARESARPGDVVLLSPASASFDQFKNFAERGEAFKRFVGEL